LEEKHEVEYNIDLVSLVCQNIFVPEIDIAVDEPSTLAFLGSNFSLGKKYVFLHPFTSNPYKKIEEEFWVALTDKVKSRGIENIVIIGSEEEKEESIRLEKILKVKNITGKIDVRNLAALLKHNCCLFVGLDSGPMHLASMLKIPVIGLFRISNPKRWGPFNTESLVIKGNDLDSFIEKLDDIVDFILNKVAVNNR
jgi:ADP-heptose:LPS heptosyltransferase